MIIWKKEASYKDHIDKNTKITKACSYIRLALGLCLLVSLICLFTTTEFLLSLIASIIFLVLFLAVVIGSNKYYKELYYDKSVLNVYFIHNKRRSLEFNALLDNGKDFLDKNDYKLSDLDIFGSKSIYQYLVSAKTKLGRVKFSERLKNKETTDIKSAVVELGNNEDTNRIEARLQEFDNKTRTIDYDQINHLVGKKIQINPLFLALDILIYIAMYVYLIVALINQYNLSIVVVLAVIAFFLPRILFNNEIFAIDALNYEKTIQAYIGVCNEILTFDFTSPRLNEIKKSAKNNLLNLNKYKKVLQALSLRKNIFINLLVKLLNTRSVIKS